MKDKEYYVQEYIKLCKELYSIELSDEDALEYFDRMVTLYKVVLGILPE